MCLFSFYSHRKYIVSRKQAEVPLSVPFDPRNQVRRPAVVKVLVLMVNGVDVHCRCIWATTTFRLWRCWPLKATGASRPRRTRSFFSFLPDSAGRGFTGRALCSLLDSLTVARFNFTPWSWSPCWASRWRRRWMFLLNEPSSYWRNSATGPDGTPTTSKTVPVSRTGNSSKNSTDI